MNKAMTREEAKELLPIIQAFAEDKKIQCDISGEWKDIEVIALSIGLEHFRIKPEQKYRVFRNSKECWNEMHKHSDFGWIKIKHNGRYSAISIMYGSCAEERIMVANSSYKLEQAFEIFTFTDGTPFGIKEE